MTTRIFASTFAMLLFTGACGDDGGGPDDSSATAGATTTDGTDSTGHSPTSTTDSTTGVTTDAPPTTSSASDGETTTVATTNATTDAPTDTTTGGVDPDLLSACGAYCGRWDECGLQPDVAGCVAGCIDNHSGLAGECTQAHLDLFACTIALTCDELLGSGEPGGPCSEQEAAVTAACAGNECARSVVGGNDECEVQIECPEAPLQQMICDGQTCTCLEGGETVGECAAEGVCAAGEAVFDKTARCCGF